MAEEPQDHSSWWESLGPVDDSPSPRFAFDDPVDWPVPVWHADGASSADTLRRALLDDIHPHQLPEVLPTPSLDGDAVADTFLVHVPLDEEEPRSPLPRPAQASPDDHHGPPTTETLVRAGSPLFVQPDGLQEFTGWRGALAGRSTGPIVIGVLAVVGVAVMASLFAARSGSSSTGSVQGRPDSGYVAANGAVDAQPITTTTVTTVPVTIDLRALAAAEMATGPTTDPAQAASDTPATTAAASGQTATTRPQAQSPATTEPASANPPPEPLPDPTVPPSATSTVPVVTTRAPRPTVPPFPAPTTPTPSSIPWPTFPRLTIPAGVGR